MFKRIKHIKLNFELIFLLYLLLISGYLMTGCNEDDLLTKHPLDRPNRSNFFVDASTARDAVNAIPAFWQQHYTMYNRYMNTYLDVLTDDSFVRENEPWRTEFNRWTFNANHILINEWWDYIYRSINAANFAIDYIPASSDPGFTEDYQAPYLAVAKLWRAFDYLYLTSFWGDVPLHMHFTEEIEYFYIPRTNKDSVMQFIISDLKYARKYLPDRWTGPDEGLPGKAAAAGLLTRAYLYNHDFVHAETAAAEAIQIADRSGYGLMDDYEYMMSEESQPNKEFILSLGYLPDDENVSLEAIIERLPRDLPGPVASIYGVGWGYALPTRNLYDAFEPNDPRRKYTMFAPGDFYGIYSGPTKTENGITYNQGDSVFYQKGWSPTNLNTRKIWAPVNKTADPMKSGYDIPLLRYAELRLYYAEALAGNNKPEEAVHQLNIIRSRPSVNMPPLDASGDVMALVRHERRVELAMEGIRIFDLLRWDKLGDVIGEGPNPEKILIRLNDDNTYKQTNLELPKNKLFPVPQLEIDRNPLINKQNPGW
ncbi:MAG TPA: RagB/SusD family nutrient uptake outer membrane protein [Bacteroidales bacterium]|nr:RagB/SusD family nutrient uptake outer membrane protein [Bacteroidales bacterium]